MISLEKKIAEINNMSREQLIDAVRGQKFTNETFRFMNIILGDKGYCMWLDVNHPDPTKNDYFKARVLAHYFENGGKQNGN